MLTLHSYLKRAGLTTGPSSLRINNSSLSALKKWMLGQPQFNIPPRYLLFGREFHKRCLEPHKRKKILTKEEEYDLKKMVDSLCNHYLFRELAKGAKMEHLIQTESINGVKVRGTLDINNQHLLAGGDPKTTSTRSRSAFIKSCFEYDYPRQAWFYKQLAGLDEFFFLGIQKKAPYGVFVMDMSDYKREMKEAQYEAEFLLEFYRVNGLPPHIKIKYK